MLPLSASLQYYLYIGVTDMRKSFDGLSGVVRDRLQADPGSGDVLHLHQQAQGPDQTAALGTRWFCTVLQTPGVRHLRDATGAGQCTGHEME